MSLWQVLAAEVFFAGDLGFWHLSIVYTAVSDRTFLITGSYDDIAGTRQLNPYARIEEKPSPSERDGMSASEKSYSWCQRQ